MTPSRKVLRLAVLTLFGMAMPAFSPAAPPLPQAATATPKIIKVTPQLTVNSLAGRPDSDLVELSNGRRLSVGSLRKLKAAQVKMRAAQPGSRLEPALKVKPAASGTPLRSATDLTAALKRPGAETVQFPSGRRATVDQIKFVQPEVEKRLGRKLSTLPQQPSAAGPSIKITNGTRKSDWLQILKKPDNTLLEAPDGKRMTVGALKQSLARNPLSRSNKPAPAAVPPQKR